MGRDRLAGFLAEHSGETPDSAYRFLDEIEASYTVLHHALYPYNQEEQTQYQKTQNIIRGLSGIYNSCERKLSERIGNSKVQSYNDVYNLNNNFKYSHNKLYAIMNDRMEYFSNNYDNNIKDLVYWNTIINKENTLAKINDIENVTQVSSNFETEEDFLNAYYWAASGRLSELSPECKQYYEIKNYFQYEFPITQEIKDKVFDNEKFGPQYDNSKAEKIIKIIKIKENGIFKTGIDKFKNFLTRKQQRLLTAGEATQNNYQSTEMSTIFPELTKEEQDYYNNQVSQAVNKMQSHSQEQNEIDKNLKDNER